MAIVEEEVTGKVYVISPECIDKFVIEETDETNSLLMYKRGPCSNSWLGKSQVLLFSKYVALNQIFNLLNVIDFNKTLCQGIKAEAVVVP